MVRAKPLRNLISAFAACVTGLMPLGLAAQTKGWGDLGKAADKGFSWTDPLWPGFWMAWTPATLALFLGIFGAIGVLTLIEVRYPGGDARTGVLGLVTTRGDRLFMTLLGTSYIFLAWLFFFGMPLWGPLALSILWGVFCFWKV
jgi:predicted small integral membrane protein